MAARSSETNKNCLLYLDKEDWRAYRELVESEGKSASEDVRRFIKYRLRKAQAAK